MSLPAALLPSELDDSDIDYSLDMVSILLESDNDNQLVRNYHKTCHGRHVGTGALQNIIC